MQKRMPLRANGPCSAWFDGVPGRKSELGPVVLRCFAGQCEAHCKILLALFKKESFA